MGWMQSMNPNKGRKELAAEILNDFRCNKYPYPTYLDHGQTGNELYLLLHNPTRRVNGVKVAMPRPADLSQLSWRLCGNYRFVALYLMRGSRDPDEGWGYKSMDESMGPNYYRCPERLLKQSQVEDRHGWREKCRQLRRDKKARKEWMKTAQQGDILSLFRGYHVVDGRHVEKYVDVVFDRAHTATFFVGHFRGESKRYRMSLSDVKMLENPDNH